MEEEIILGPQYNHATGKPDPCCHSLTPAAVYSLSGFCRQPSIGMQPRGKRTFTVSHLGVSFCLQQPRWHLVIRVGNRVVRLLLGDPSHKSGGSVQGSWTGFLWT